jgi:hypothetical protein
MHDGDRQRSNRGLPVVSLRVLLYRYFFFDWLFRDASRGSLLERQEALRFNREMSPLLLVYLRRWIALVIFSCALGASFEKGLLLDCTAAVFYCVSTASFVTAAIIARLWVGLRFD